MIHAHVIYMLHFSSASYGEKDGLFFQVNIGQSIKIEYFVKVNFEVF